MWDNYFSFLDRSLKKRKALPLTSFIFFFFLSSCFTSSLCKATSSPKSARHPCIFYFVSEGESEENKQTNQTQQCFTHLDVDGIQVWKAKDRLFFIKFPREQTVSLHSSEIWLPKLFLRLQEYGPTHTCVKHWSTGKWGIGSAGENRGPNAIGKITLFRQQTRHDCGI